MLGQLPRMGTTQLPWTQLHSQAPEPFPRGCQRLGPQPTAHAGGSALTRLPSHASSPVAHHAPRSARSLGPAKLVSGGANVRRAGAKRQMRLQPRLAPSFHPRPHLSRRRAGGRRNWRLSRPRNPAPAVIYGWLRGTPAALRNYGAFKARGQRSSTAPSAQLKNRGSQVGAPARGCSLGLHREHQVSLRVGEIWDLTHAGC